MSIKKGLPAFNIKNAKIVILGTFPGELSLCAKEYYSDSRNQFWQLLGITATDYKAKMKALEEKGIALWDVIASCERDGSADKNIKNMKYNDLSLLKGKTVLFNGKKAYNIFLTAKKQQNIELNVTDKCVLPSSSAALAVTLKDKKRQWDKIINKYK